MKIEYKLHKKYEKKEETIRLVIGEVPYFVFPLFEKTGIVRHGFSTKVGGVSRPPFDTLNLSFTRGDDPQSVGENFRRIGQSMGILPEQMVMSAQTHTTNIRIVEQSDMGNGITGPQTFSDVDALITNERGICLVTSYADCVPLYFLDPVKKVIGCSHAGWRGTVGKIGPKTVEMFAGRYGSDPKDILAVIGPSICQDCYQVSEEVAQRVYSLFGKNVDDNVLRPEEMQGNAGGEKKYRLNLWEVNKRLLIEAGLSQEHIAVAGLCTKCNSHIMFSHRETGERRGNLCAFLQLK